MTPSIAAPNLFSFCDKVDRFCNFKLRPNFRYDNFVFNKLDNESFRPKKITLVSGNADDKKNLHPGGRKFIFFNRFSGDLLFTSLFSFSFFDSCFFVCLFDVFDKNVYSNSHLTMQADE